MRIDQINKINSVLADYFAKHPGTTIRAKEMMDSFIKANIFQYDHREGLPIRELLRELDRNNMLHLIPYVHAERKLKNTYWYFSDIA